MEFPNTIHVQDIGYLFCNVEMKILQITNEPDGSEFIKYPSAGK